MKLKSIEIEGFHNIIRKKYEFSDFTYVAGPNGSGKSTVLEAVQLAILGYIPGTSKNSNQALMQHANGKTMSVTAKLDDDGQEVEISRIFIASKSGSARSEVVVTPEGYDIGSIVADIELPLFNFNDFLALSSNKLKDWFIDFLPSYDVKTDWGEELAESARENNVECSDDILKETCKSIADLELTGLDEIRSANNYFKQCISFEKKRVEELSASVRQLIYHEDVDNSRTADEVDEERQRLEKELATIQRYFEAVRYNEEILERSQAFDDLKADDFSKDETFLKLVDEEIKLKEESAKVDEEIRSLFQEELELNAETSANEKIISSKGVCPFTDSPCDSISGILEDIKKSIDEIDKNRDAITRTLNEKSKELQDVSIRLEHVRSEISCIKHQYEEKERFWKFNELKDVVEIEDTSDEYIQKLKDRIRELLDEKSKIMANEQYDSLVETVTIQKYEHETKLALYKIWEKLTSVNGLQSENDANMPFEDFASAMNPMLSKMFERDVEAAFTLVGKANSFDFGIKDVSKNTYIPYNLLSSGEKCMFTLALFVSIVQTSSSPLKLVIVDDLLDHLDHKHIDTVIECMNTVKGAQLLFAGVNDVKLDSSNIINVEED